MTSPIDDNLCNCFSDSYVRRFTKENMIETLYIHLQNCKDAVEETLQDIEDIQKLISQLEEEKTEYRNGRPLC